KRCLLNPTTDRPSKLYLLQQSTASIPTPAGGKLEMSSGSYLVQTADHRNMLIDTEMDGDASRGQSKKCAGAFGGAEGATIRDFHGDLHPFRRGPLRLSRALSTS